MTRGELAKVVAEFRALANAQSAEEARLCERADAGEISYEVCDSKRFDIWQDESEQFRDLLAAVEEYLEVVKR